MKNLKRAVSAASFVIISTSAFSSGFAQEAKPKKTRAEFIREYGQHPKIKDQVYDLLKSIRRNEDFEKKARTLSPKYAQVLGDYFKAEAELHKYYLETALLEIEWQREIAETAASSDREAAQKVYKQYQDDVEMVLRIKRAKVKEFESPILALARQRLEGTSEWHKQRTAFVDENAQALLIDLLPDTKNDIVQKSTAFEEKICKEIGGCKEGDRIKLVSSALGISAPKMIDSLTNLKIKSGNGSKVDILTKTKYLFEDFNRQNFPFDPYYVLNVSVLKTDGSENKFHFDYKSGTTTETKDVDNFLEEFSKK